MYHFYNAKPLNNIHSNFHIRDLMHYHAILKEVCYTDYEVIGNNTYKYNIYTKVVLQKTSSSSFLACNSKIA